MRPDAVALNLPKSQLQAWRFGTGKRSAPFFIVKLINMRIRSKNSKRFSPLDGSKGSLATQVEIRLGKETPVKFRLGFCLLIFALVCGLFPMAVTAAPAQCSQPGNFCTVPMQTPWKFQMVLGFGLYTPLRFYDSEADAVAATSQRMVNGTGWCTVDLTSVTHDDNPAWGGTPVYSGNVDIQHGDTHHYDAVGYASQGCVQNWTYNPGQLRSRLNECPDGLSAISDTSVTPSALFCLGTNGGSSPLKQAGTCPKSGLVKGNPCEVASGNKFEREVDYQAWGTSPLGFVRSYNSLSARLQWAPNSANPFQPLGRGWTATYFQRVSVATISVGATTYQTAYAFRPDGKLLMFNRSGSDWVAVGADMTDELRSVSAGYEYQTGTDMLETYDAAGRLTEIRSRSKPTQTLAYAGDSLRPASVSDDLGNTLQFAYTEIANLLRLTQITDPSGSVIQFSYDTAARLVAVAYPDTTTRGYAYNTLAQLTTLTDESAVAFGTWTYDPSTTLVTSSSHAGGVDNYTFAYSGSNRTVTDPHGTVRNYTTSRSWGINRLTGSSVTCAGCSESAAVSYDTNGNVVSRRDFNGNLSCYAYDSVRNLETVRVEGFASTVAACPASPGAYTPAPGTRERKVATGWHSTLRLPISITEAGRVTTFTHDANGNVLTRTVTDTSVTPNVSRVWTYTYDGFGRVLTEDGARTDVSDLTTYVYYTGLPPISLTLRLGAMMISEVWDGKADVYARVQA